ncbi:MAG: oligopeptidase B, partial [Bacteroidales bacterium]|nr:oligopeptidase B [Bacteroidales bacterium]
MLNKRNFPGIAFIMIAVILFLSCSRTKQINKMKPPIAEKVKKELTLHGDTRIDNYFWMRLTDEQKNAKEPDVQTKKVLNYLKAENAYKSAVMKHASDFQQELYDEIVERIKQDDESVPYLDNGYYYYSRYEEGDEYPLYCRKKGSLEAEEEIMLNVNDLAEGYEYFHATGISVSPDNKLLAYGIDTVSRRRYTIYFKKLETGELLDDQISNTTGGSVWANDNETVFYTVKNMETLRSEWIKKHKLGIDPASDKEVFHETDEEFSVGA